MNVNPIRNILLGTVLLVVLISTHIISVGCQEESTPPSATSTYNELSSTSVPNMNLKGKTIPILVRIDGNRIFATISGQESYAQTLITSISR